MLSPTVGTVTGVTRVRRRCCTAGPGGTSHCHSRPGADTTGAGLAWALTRLAVERGPEVESPAVPSPGSDPDADEAELFYPGFYTDAPDASAGVDQPVVWGEARVLGPEDDLVTTETYAAGDAALADLNPIDAGLVTLSSTSKGPH